MGKERLDRIRTGFNEKAPAEAKAIMSRAAEEIRALGAELVAISPQVGEKNEEVRKNHRLEYPVLGDPGNGYAKKRSIVYLLRSVERLRQGAELLEPFHELPMLLSPLVALEKHLEQRHRRQDHEEYDTGIHLN